MKNYVGFVNDHSGSMARLAESAIKDYNSIVKTIKDAASKEQLDTIVSVVGIGLRNVAGKTVQTQVCFSNPHVLKPIRKWEANAHTPLYDGIGKIIELHQGLPDANDPNVSFLIMITTDGVENGSNNFDRYSIKKLIEKLQATGRWTFVARVERKDSFPKIGIPEENIQEWATTAQGMETLSVQTQSAINTYYSQRSTGSKSSTTFFAQANVDTSKLTDVTKEISLYVVGQNQMGILIEDFVLTKRAKYLKGAAFYQLTKTEPRISRDKLILIRDRTTGKFYAGNDARNMIGVPLHTNARLHPGDHGNYDIFIQSDSLNRKLVAGTGLAYWPAKGTEVTQADRDMYKPKDTTAKPIVAPVVELPKVTPTCKPTPNPIPKTKKEIRVNGKPATFHPSREAARTYARCNGGRVQDGRVFNVQGPNQERWFTSH